MHDRVSHITEILQRLGVNIRLHDARDSDSMTTTCVSVMDCIQFPIKGPVLTVTDVYFIMDKHYAEMLGKFDKMRRDLNEAYINCPERT